MAKGQYGAGDIVVLKDGPLRTSRSTSKFKILAVMPEAGGEVQYRVRSDIEGFERRITAGEIDIEKSAASKHTPVESAPKSVGEPWFKPSAVKTKK
jgi:ERCC4-type nuclease